MFVVEFIQDGREKTAPYLFKHKIDADKYAKKLMGNARNEYIAFNDYDADTLNIVPYHERYSGGFAVLHMPTHEKIFLLTNAVVKKYKITTFDELVKEEK